MSGSLILVPSPGLFSFCLSYPNAMCLGFLIILDLLYCVIIYN